MQSLSHAAFFNASVLGLYKTMSGKIISESHFCLRIKSLFSTRSLLGTFFLKPLPFFPLNCLGSICVQLSNPLRTEFLDFYFRSGCTSANSFLLSSLLCNTLLKAEGKCQYTLSLTLQQSQAHQAFITGFSFTNCFSTALQALQAFHL